MPRSAFYPKRTWPLTEMPTAAWYNGPTPANRERRMSGSIAALFQRLTQGVYVVGVAHGEVRNAFTAAWVMQVSFDPLLLALSINPHHSSYGLLKEGRAFSVNVLKKGPVSYTHLRAHETDSYLVC